MSKTRDEPSSPSSPFEQGELAPSPVIHLHDEDDDNDSHLSLSPHSKEAIDDDDDDDEEMEEEEEDVVIIESPKKSGSKGRDDLVEDGESLDIKPPQAQASKKDKGHKHRHKEEKKREKDRHNYERERDRDRPDRNRHDYRTNNRDKHDARESYRHKESDRARKVKDAEKEFEKRRKSIQERERLERIEREREREKRMREDRERKELERRKKREEDRYQATQSQARSEEKYRRDQKERKVEKSSFGRSRSRDRHRDTDVHIDRRDSKSSRHRRRSPKQEQKRQGPHTPEEEYHPPRDIEKEESEEEEVEESEEEEVSLPKSQKEVKAETHSDVSRASEDSESDSGSDSESESGSSSGSGSESEGKHSEEDDPKNEEKRRRLSLLKKIESKFDDHEEEESDVESDHPSHPDNDSGKYYLEDTPPESPIELKPDLPVYLPAIQGCRNVEEFHCLNRIEEGTYGVVYRARDKKTDEIVALKRLKMEKEKEGFPITSLREINTLLKAQHQNIVTVREIVVGSNMDKIYIVMDYVEHDLKSLMETMKQPFLVGEVKTLLLQLLKGVHHLHDNWIIHRDLKSSNLLLSHKGILKIGDFGLAREYGSPLKHYTPIVVTLWYRAPELLLGVKEYSTPIDMWSVGCIFAEFLTMKALWPGKSEIDQLNRIFKDLGTPNEKIWPGVSELPGMKKCTFTEHPYNTLRKTFGSYLSDSGFDLLNRFLTYMPSKRMSAEDACKHEYFKESPLPVDPSMFPTWPAKSEQPRKHSSSPKPPSGGKAYAKLMMGDEDEKAIAAGGFHLTNAAKGVSAVGPGFSLKF